MKHRPIRFARTLAARAFCTLLVALGAAPVLAAADQSCVVDFVMVDDIEVNNLEFKVDYSGAGGQIEGSGAGAVCRRALGGAMAAFNDNDASKTIRFGLVRLHKFSGPVLLAGCRFLYDSAIPQPSQFKVSVQVAAVDGSDVNVSPLPRVQASKVVCPGELPVPTSTTTTTTLLPTTTTVVEVTSTTLEGSSCGSPVTGSDTPEAVDALYTLRAAVGLVNCPACLCDVDGSSEVTAGDALRVLRAAVGISIAFDCPACS